MKVVSENYTVEIQSVINSSLENLLNVKYSNNKKIIFVDENTHEYCLEYLLTNFEALHDAEVIVLPSGEENKTVHTCIQVWEALAEYRITRKDVVICLGGGVVTDMGGMIASLYKRGIDFIHIPTSLLAMVDASIGGKTAVDLLHYKNMIGVFSNPKAVYVDTAFLHTLQLEDKVGGWMEMLKHGLIADKKHWSELKAIDFNDFKISDELIYNSLNVKNTIVQKDPFEKNERKKLNFGHTFGHAIESFFLENESPINHGIAVGIGIVVESFWSKEKELISEEQLEEITTMIFDKVSLPDISMVTVENIWDYMLNDKKNEKTDVLAVLLKDIGEAVVDQEISKNLVEKGVAYYLRKNV